MKHLQEDAGAVIDALEGFLDGRELDAREQVLGEIARALAQQLDSACEAGAARGLSAGPPLARRRAEVLDALVVREAEEAADAARDAARAERVELRRRAGRLAQTRTAHEAE